MFIIVLYSVFLQAINKNISINFKLLYSYQSGYGGTAPMVNTTHRPTASPLRGPSPTPQLPHFVPCKAMHWLFTHPPSNELMSRTQGFCDRIEAFGRDACGSIHESRARRASPKPLTSSPKQTHNLSSKQPLTTHPFNSSVLASPRNLHAKKTHSKNKPNPS